MAEFNSLFELMRAIPDEDAAVEHFRSIRWRNGAFCPYCGSTKVYNFSDKRTHKCGDCRQRFSIKVGTIFEDSKIPLRKWLMAIWLLTSNRKGIASTQLARDIEVTQKSAWFMLHRLRYAATTKSFNAPLDGVVEADETFIGGKEKNKHTNKRVGGTQGGKGKAVVFGMLDRDGDVRAMRVADRKAATLQPIIEDNVTEGSVVITDELGSYDGLDDRFHHQTVNHRIGEYVLRGEIHTNGIESVWALMKRQIIGTHHWLSHKHLWRYVDEMTWRYNRRELGEGERVNALITAAGGRLKYKALIA